MDFYTKFIKLLIKNDLDKMKEINKISDIEERAMNLILKVADKIEKKQNSKERYCFVQDLNSYESYLIPLSLKEKFYELEKLQDKDKLWSMFDKYLCNSVNDINFTDPQGMK